MEEQAVSQWLRLLMKIDNTGQNRAFWKDRFLKRKIKQYTTAEMFSVTLGN